MLIRRSWKKHADHVGHIGYVSYDHVDFRTPDTERPVRCSQKSYPRFPLSVRAEAGKLQGEKEI